MYYNGEGVVYDLAGEGVATDSAEAARRQLRLAADQRMAQARDALAQNSFGPLQRKGVPVPMCMPKEAATPKVAASMYMLTSGQVPVGSTHPSTCTHVSARTRIHAHTHSCTCACTHSCTHS